VSDVLQDVRYAFRLLVRQPGFTFITVAVLALGIGATTAIFSVVDAVLLRPLTYAHADRLVSLSNLWKRDGGGVRGTVSAPDFHDWHDQASSFDGMAAYFGGQTSVTIGAAADYVSVIRVTPEFFSVLSARAELGRLLSESEQQTGGALAVVVSHAFWQSRLGGKPDAIGRTLKFNQRVYAVVGVLAPSFRFPANADVWAPWWVVPETPSRSAHNYRAIGRLKPGVELSKAQAEMDGIAARLEREYPESNEGKAVAVDLLRDQVVRNVRTTLNLIFGVVLVVLLIACANVSNLLLARASSRTRELGVRTAVGATRARVVRQLITESALLALIAGVAGVLVAVWGVRGLVAIAPQGLPRLDKLAIDGRVLAFALIASIATSFAFGLAPAMQTSRVDVNEVLKQGSRSPAGGAGSRMRSALIVFEVAAAVVLTIAASLLIRSFAALTAADMGFPTDHLLVADTIVPSANIDAARQAVRFYRDLLPQLAAIPGVRSVAATTGVPTVVRSNGGYAIDGGPSFEQMRTRSPQALFTVVTPNYFDTIGARLVRGRDIGPADIEGAPLVAVINESMRREAFGDTDPVGRRIVTGFDAATGPDGTGFMTIVGVAADVRASDPSIAARPQIYMPFQQHPFPASSLTLVLRTASDPLQAATPTLQKIRSLNGDVPVRIRTMDDLLGIAVSAPRFRMILLVLFAALALVLAMAGVYGLVSFSVSQRTGEVGLRMALGARRSQIVALTLASGLKLTVAGVLIGWVAAFALVRLLSSMLYKIPAHDMLVFAAAPLLLTAVAALASLAPALRASRVDPAVALRAE
jgi:putative ABC transport system permease protein